MSVSEHELGDNEELALRAGTRVPFTMVGDWVLLSDLSVHAKLLYSLLQAHVNVSDKGRRVWPSRENLAAWMGFSRPQSVDRYLDELEIAGAIEKEQQRTGRGMKTRNIYIVHGEAPPGLDTPTRFADYYAARRDARDAAGQDVVRSSAQRDEQAQHVSAGDHDVRPSAQRCAPQRTPVVRSSAPELDKEELDQREGGATRAHADTHEGTPDPTGPPPPPQLSEDGIARATIGEGWTLVCGEHWELRRVDRAANVPPCSRCRDVRQWAEVKQDTATAAEHARAEQCPWHDEYGFVVDPETGMPFEPAWKCKHDLSPDDVRKRVQAAHAEGTSKCQPLPSESGRQRVREALAAKRREKAARVPEQRSEEPVGDQEAAVGA